MPKSSSAIRKVLEIEKATWNKLTVKPHIKLDEVEILFTRYDEKAIAKELEEAEKERLKKEKELAKVAKKEEKKSDEPKEQITIDKIPCLPLTNR